MKADDFRFELFDDIAHRVIERHSRGGPEWGIGIQSALAIIRLEPAPPGELALFVNLRRSMTEEIEIHRPRRRFASNRFQFSADLIGRQKRAGERSEPTGLRYSDYEPGVHCACHRRLDDRQFNMQQILNPTVRPMLHCFECSLRYRHYRTLELCRACY